MRSLLALLIVLFAPVVLCAQGRSVEPFNQGWEFRKGTPADSTGSWEPVTLPHTWNAVDMQTAKNAYYAGPALYKRSLYASPSLTGKRVFLRFGGVASVCEVRVNGQFAGNHRGGYSAFAVEITRLLNEEADNEITVLVDNTPQRGVIPINNTLFGVYGGIYRPVDLVVTEKVNIAVTDYASPGIYITTRDISAKRATVEVLAKLENKYLQAQPIEVSATIRDAAGKVVVASLRPVELSPQGRRFERTVLTVPRPHLWQGLEDPYLYRVTVQLLNAGRVIDEVSQPLGIRSVELRAADGVYLNGRKIPMYGVCRHQDWWGIGSALQNHHHDTDLEIIREMGATTIRFAHYQQSEYLYSRCDSIGFLIWAEIPFVNRVSTEEADNAKQQLIELIRQNYNHPSIYIWGLHNEVYMPYEHTVPLTTDLHDLAKSEDPSRYTVSVSGYSKLNQASNLTADVQGINHYFGWYNGKIGDVENWIADMEEHFPGYKVIFSEYGAEANIYQQEEVVGESGRWFSQFYPETFATKFHEIQWGVIARHPYLIASYVWNSFDFATPATTQGGVEARNMKGLVTFDRQTKKDPYYWYKANWSSEPVLYLTQRRATERENRVTPVTVYSNIGIPRLFVNGREYTRYEKGTTDVHYIFPGIELAEGKNTVEVSREYRGTTHTDRVEWNYSPDYRPDYEKKENKEKTKEHIGL